MSQTPRHAPTSDAKPASDPAASPLPHDARHVMLSGSVMMLDLLRLYSKTLDLDADSIFILLYVVQQSMGEFLKDPGQVRAWVEVPVAQDARGWVSRRAVAEGTGQPRETVRRKMAVLAARGLIIEDENGCIRVRNDAPGHQGLLEFTRDFQACVERHSQRCALTVSTVQ